MIRQIIADLFTNQDGRLVAPAPSHVTQRVAAAADDHQRNVEVFDKLDTLADDTSQTLKHRNVCHSMSNNTGN